MHKDNNENYGLTWNELGDVWYKSIHMRLSATSGYKDVRRCVVWAAQEVFADLDFETSSKKLAVIKAAFKEVGIEGQEENYGTIYGTVTEMSRDRKIPVDVVQVTAYEKRLVGGEIVPKSLFSIFEVVYA